MSIQSQLNQDAIEMLPLVKAAIANAGTFEGNQMHCYTIRECLNSQTPIAFMSGSELQEFQNNLLDVFNKNNWL